MRPRWTEARDARLSRHRLRQTTEEDRQGPAEAHEERSTCVRRFRTDLPRGFLHIRAARISADLRAEYVAQIQDFQDTLHQCFWNRETARTLTDRGKEDVAARAARPANRTPPTRRTRPRHRNAGSSKGLHHVGVGQRGSTTDRPAIPPGVGHNQDRQPIHCFHREGAGEHHV